MFLIAYLFSAFLLTLLLHTATTSTTMTTMAVIIMKSTAINSIVSGSLNGSFGVCEKVGKSVLVSESVGSPVGTSVCNESKRLHGFRPETESFDFSKKQQKRYHQTGHLKRSRMVQMSAF